MPKTLSPRQLNRLPDGTHRVAPSLYLQVRGGSRLWTLRYQLAGKARTMSLGALDAVPVEAAIAAAATARMQVRLHGVDVLVERRALRAQQVAAITEARAQEPKPIRKSGHTFGELLDVATPLEARAKGWKHGPTACTQWTAPIRKYCGALVNKDVTMVTESALIETLTEAWTASHLQATRALTRTITLMGHARRLGWIKENPLDLKRTQEKLPAMPKRKSRHHAAMPLRAVPALMQALAADGTILSDLLRLVILSGTRANEAAGMRWAELDLVDRIWSIPAERMKAKRAHRVPLTDTMLEILKARQNARTDDDDNALVFPGKGGNPFTSQQVLALLISKGHVRRQVTVHGMRSTLRQFLAEHTRAEYVVAELCLAHDERSATQRSYDRSDYLRERAGLMAAWEAYCAGRVKLDTGGHAVVLPLRDALAA